MQCLLLTASLTTISVVLNVVVYMLTGLMTEMAFEVFEEGERLQVLHSPNNWLVQPFHACDSF